MFRLLGLGLALLFSAGGPGARLAFAATDSVQLRVTPFMPDSFSAPSVVTDLAAGTNPTIEGEVLLSWTAPDGNSPASGMTAGAYLVRAATFSIDSLAGDTTAWWNLASSVTATVALPQAPGSLELLTITGLEPGNTYYFAIRSTDTASLISSIDERAETGGLPQAFALITDLKPPVPANPAVSPTASIVTVSWSPVVAADLDFYRVHVDSTLPYDFADQFIIAVDSTSTSLTHSGLTPGTTYNYYITAVDKGAPVFAGLPLESDPSATVQTLTLRTGTLPMEPIGIRVAHNGNQVTFDWSQTTRFDNGVPFVNPDAPTSDELIGYRILRSTHVCAPDFVWVASNTFAITTWTGDDANSFGDPYYYQLQSYNALGRSTNTLSISQQGDQHYSVEGCATTVRISKEQAAALSGLTNDFGKDIRIMALRRPEDTGGEILQSVEFTPMLDGGTEARGFHFASPVRISLNFVTAGGVPVPQTSALGVQAAGSGARPSAAQDLKNLGMYWHNGAEFKKLYGKVDSVAQTVSVESPNLGRYQIRSVARAAGVVFDLSNLSSRVITPNDDGLNDVMIFTYDPGPDNVTPEGKIYDLHGARIADMTPGLVPNTLTWDGKINGRAAASGVYAYQIKGGGKTFSGSIVVAR